MKYLILLLLVTGCSPSVDSLADDFYDCMHSQSAPLTTVTAKCNRIWDKVKEHKDYDSFVVSNR